MQIPKYSNILFKHPIQIRDSNYGHYGILNVSWMLTAFTSKTYISYYDELFALGIL